MAATAIPSLTGVQQVVEHGLDKVHFHVSLNPSESNEVTINPNQLMMSAGVQDLDHMCTTAIQVDDARLEGGLAGSKAGIVFDYGPGIQAPTAHRVTHIGSNNVADCVHAVATSAGLNHPIKFSIGPSEQERGVGASSRARIGLARTARWQGVTTADLDHDVQEFTRGGETRYLVPSAVTETSSGIAKLFDYNRLNKAFLNGEAHEDVRANVGDGFVVTGANLENAKATLKSNLSPVTEMATHGLRVRTVDLDGSEATKACPVSVRFHLIRQPLTKDGLVGESAEAPHLHDGMMTLADAQTAVGEDTVAAVQGSASAPVSAQLDDVFAAKLTV